MAESILEMVGITKEFPGVRALDNVNFKVLKGEVHAIVGENGAGKSTLMKILNGVNGNYTGEIFVNGKKVSIHNPLSAQAAGISIIYQEFNLVNSLSIGENIYLGRLFKKKSGMVNWKMVYDKASRELERAGFKIDPKTIVGTLSVAEKQMVEIAKALSYHANIIVMDEPSAVLTKSELDNLFEIIRDLKAHGITVIYISHRMEEIFEICDSVTCMRDGKVIDTQPVRDTTEEKLIEQMVGRKMGGACPPRKTKDFSGSEVVLEVQGLTRKNVLDHISFQLHKGEILGISGLVGAGRTELLRAIFGADPIDSGKLYVRGREVSINSPIDAMKYGIALIPEDRKEQGLILKFPVKTNITLTNMKKSIKSGILSSNAENQFAKEYIEMLSIKTPSVRQKVVNLSGGNQQKVVIAKWLYDDAEILFLDEPTRGIDVGAKYEIYCLMQDLIKKGKSIVMVSSDLPEILGMSDRVLVMNHGCISGEMESCSATAEGIMKCCV